MIYNNIISVIPLVDKVKEWNWTKLFIILRDFCNN